jgi:hypothetical protein
LSEAKGQCCLLQSSGRSATSPRPSSLKFSTSSPSSRPLRNPQGFPFRANRASPVSDACPGSELLARCQTPWLACLIHSGVRPVPVWCRPAKTFDRESSIVPSVMRLVARASAQMIQSVPTLPLYRRSGDSEPSVRGRPAVSDSARCESRGCHAGLGLELESASVIRSRTVEEVSAVCAC